jgi:dephospho-CoA kinase
MNIIGITGTLGAGKGTIVDYLVKQHNFTHYPVRKYIEAEIAARGLENNRDNMVIVGNDLRKNDGAFIFKALKKQAEKERQEHIIIESIRTVDEITALKALGGVLFSVDADRTLRYERVVPRGTSTDSISYETFLEHEERESISTDPAKQNLRACAKLADFHFMNDNSFEDLYRQIDTAIKKINAPLGA